MEDRQGILARVVSTISNMKTNIRQMETRTGDGKATVELVLEIADLKHLEKVIALARPASMACCASIASTTSATPRLSGRTCVVAPPPDRLTEV